MSLHPAGCLMSVSKHACGHTAARNGSALPTVTFEDPRVGFRTSLSQTIILEQPPHTWHRSCRTYPTTLRRSRSIAASISSFPTPSSSFKSGGDTATPCAALASERRQDPVSAPVSANATTCPSPDRPRSQTGLASGRVIERCRGIRAITWHSHQFSAGEKEPVYVIALSLNTHTCARSKVGTEMFDAHMLSHPLPSVGKPAGIWTLTVPSSTTSRTHVARSPRYPSAWRVFGRRDSAVAPIIASPDASHPMCSSSDGSTAGMPHAPSAPRTGGRRGRKSRTSVPDHATPSARTLMTSPPINTGKISACTPASNTPGMPGWIVTRAREGS
mmetsp:Transcript_34206/g.81035  ORF Transcript_34206/g.81035 Transcript_34206/m.81035 type:complete len:330 (-) Transcript_34206:257-1246(-)